MMVLEDETQRAISESRGLLFTKGGEIIAIDDYLTLTGLVQRP